jgi:hypothetical protein
MSVTCPANCVPPPGSATGFARSVAGGTSTTPIDTNCQGKQTNAKTALRTWYDVCPTDMNDVRSPALTNERTSFLQGAEKAYEIAVQQYNALIANGDRAAVAATRLAATKAALEREKAALLAEKTDANQMARRHRRAFQDGDPQSGVGGSPGVRTLDDRILIAFWINMGAAIIALVVALSWRSGASRASTTGTVVGALLAAYGVAYYCITKWA